MEKWNGYNKTSPNDYDDDGDDCDDDVDAYILKAKKFAEPLFQ